MKFSKNHDKAESVTDFGERQLNRQNFSRTVVLPKIALKNCGCDLEKKVRVNVSLVQKGDEKFIKVSPICEDLDEDVDDEDNDDE